jgi:hypothetical protein
MTADEMPENLSPREQALIWLHQGRTALWIAGELGCTERAVKDAGQAYGWPRSSARIRGIAKQLLDGDRDGGRYAGMLGITAEPAAPALTEVATGNDPEGDASWDGALVRHALTQELGALEVEGQPQSAAEATTEDPAEVARMARDAAADAVLDAAQPAVTFPDLAAWQAAAQEAYSGQQADFVAVPSPEADRMVEAGLQAAAAREDVTAVLATLDRMERRAAPYTLEQQQRWRALVDVQALFGHRDPTLDELTLLAEYVVTGHLSTVLGGDER